MSEARTLDFPGFIDVHVHFRDPGMPEAETTETGLAAAARGGFSAVVTMPNTTPACDTPGALARQLAASRPPASGGRTRIFPSACLTAGRRGEAVADLERLADAGAAFFTDDGSYVADDRVMEEAMRRAAKLGLAVCQHAMDPKVQAGGVIRDCALARRLGLPVIRPETETAAIRRDLALCRVTGCRLHVQHISTAEGVGLVRDAQREGLPVTAEATPHHLLLSCDALAADDANFKMAPPLGNDEDRAELRRAVRDGVLMFATDHAPHPAAAKARGFRESANGIVGLETAVGITYRVMVAEESMSADAWARAWTALPASILAPRYAGEVAALPGTSVSVGDECAVDPAAFASRSRNCPYAGLRLAARPL